MTQEELLRLIDEAAADGRTTLDLAGEGLIELPPEIGKLTDLKTLVLGRWDKKKSEIFGNNLKTLPDEIGQLVGLRSLYLCRTQLERIPEFVGQLTNLKSLDLSFNQLEEVPEFINQLKDLKSLDLSFNQLEEVPEFVDQLKNLKSLSLGRAQLKEIPEFIDQLKDLKSLDLSHNQLEDIPEFMGQLTNLKLLDLSFNQLGKIPNFMGQLTNLKSLDIGHNQLKEVPDSIGQLKELKSLELYRNQLKEVPDSIGQLKELKSLYLSRSQLEEIPEFIDRLTNLKLLDLSHNQLKKVPDSIDRLVNLELLDLSHNQLEEVPNSIGRLKKLRSLDLRSNQIKELPQVVTQLSSLTSLILWDNKISTLPDWVNQLALLKRLDLRANQLPIPPEILGGKEWYLPPTVAEEVIDYYFKEKSDTPLYEAKLLIVGEGEAGKTTLAKKLQNPNYELPTDEKSTEGIEVLPYEFDHPDGHPCKVNIWDFGGQEIYHATHQFFLTERAVYALVTDSRQGNTDFYFWLNVIQLHGADSPVILIKNEKNDRPCAVPDLQLRGQFKNLKESIEVNLADNRNLDAVKTAIQHHITHLSHVGDPLPKTWANVRSVLENQALGSDNYISLYEYRQICTAQGIPDRTEQNRLSRFLHNLGVFLHFQAIPQLAKTIFLTPAWSTDAVYKVLDTPKVRKDCGRFTHQDLQEIWSDNQYADVRSELLALMQQFEVCYEITGRPHHYIAPHLLEANLPEYLQYQTTWDTHNNLILTYHYPFKPKNIFPRFIVALHRYIEKQRLVWKHGVVLIIGSACAEIIEDAHYNNANIRIRVSGTDKKRILAIIGHELERIHSSFEDLKYQTLIPCNCAECKDSQEPYQFAYNVLQRSREKRNFEVQCQKSFDMVSVNRLIDDVIEPRIFEEREDPRRDAHQKPSDKSPFGDQRVEIKVNFAEQQYQESRDVNISGDVQDSLVVAGDRNTITHSSQVNQHGKGDNFAGDRVARDKIQTQAQTNSHPELAQVARDIKALLDELSEEYNPTTEKGKTKISSGAIAQIKANPQLKQRTFKAMKSAGEEALEQAIQHPVAKVVVEGVKGFLES